MKRLVVIFTLIVLLCSLSVAQVPEVSLEMPNIVPVSPEAAAVQKYVDYPVDYSTGVPNITIPLYEIVFGDLRLPISISYHSSGLKPKGESGIVGTGWTLTAAPSIMRSVLGVADNGTTASPDIGILKNNYPPDPSGYYERDYRKARIVKNEIDGESDKYSYQLPTGSGSGYFSDFCKVGPNYSDDTAFGNLYNRELTTAPRTNDVVLYNLTENRFGILGSNGVNYTLGYITINQSEAEENNTCYYPMDM